LENIFAQEENDNQGFLKKIAELRILRFKISAKYYLGDRIEEYKVDGLCVTSVAEHKFLQKFDEESVKEETQ
jgi:hypothetical protein